MVCQTLKNTNNTTTKGTMKAVHMASVQLSNYFMDSFYGIVNH